MIPAPTTYAGQNRRRAKPSPRLIALALAAVAAVVFVTVCPIGLRPHVLPANLERFGAYVVLGFLIALACGRRRLTATSLVVLLAVGLEASQVLAPGRHAQVADALVKTLGGVVGCFMGQLAFPARRLYLRLRARAAGATAVAARVSQSS